jgi:kynureninase
VALWQTRMGDAWDVWSDEMAAYRSRLARLIGAPRPDCVVPKTSAGQGLRTILNSYDQVPKVITTRGEFDSIDLILRQYARRGRIELKFVEAGADGLFAGDDLRRALASKVDLLVVSQVMFSSGQIVPELAELVAAARNAGARVLLDIYHSVGVIPLDIGALDADFAIGGSYKYLRGGPGACYLYLHPRHLDGTLSTLDVGWFGKKDPFSYQRPDPPQFGEGGDAFLESTPPVLTLYQARAGQVFTQAIGVERLRAYSLTQQQRLVGLLTAKGIVAEGGTPDRGAFTIVRDTHATQWADALDKAGLKTDARGSFLRVCPDLLNTDAELVDAVERMAAVVRG